MSLAHQFFTDNMGYLPEDGFGQDLHRFVVEGFWPFKLRQTQLYLEFDIDFGMYHLYVDALGNNWRFAWKEPIDMYGLARNPEQTVLKVSRQLLQAFRQREPDPIEDNVVLGEN
jgi:hypothetical protein